METFIDIELPKNFMNVGITASNYLIADTNNSENWDTLKFPLPKGKWSIHSFSTKPGFEDQKTILKLIDNRGWLMRFLKIYNY